MKTILLVVALGLLQNPQPPPLTLSKADAKVDVKGGAVNGSYTYTRVGSLAAWGPLSGGLIEIQNDSGGTFQYTASGKPGKYKTSVGAPLVVQVGKGPQVKVIKSAAGECTVTITRAEQAGLAGTFDCGTLPVTGSENKNVGVIASMSGAFSASK